MLTPSVAATALASALALISLGGGLYEFRVIHRAWPRRPDLIQPARGRLSRRGWLDRARRLQVDDPEIRTGIVKALSDYTTIWRKRCTPPDATSWTNSDNNKAFLVHRRIRLIHFYCRAPRR